MGPETAVTLTETLTETETGTATAIEMEETGIEIVAVAVAVAVTVTATATATATATGTTTRPAQHPTKPVIDKEEVEAEVGAGVESAAQDEDTHATADDLTASAMVLFSEMSRGSTPYKWLAEPPLLSF